MSALPTGILIMNLGTPDAPTPEKVGEYLNEFLMDPYVVDIPAVLRWILVKVLIVPRRSHKSAEAYQKIWTERGSPLKFNGEDLTARVQEILGQAFEVKFAMRYQNPSLKKVLTEWKDKNVSEIRVMPLYPQYALASTKSSEAEVVRVAKEIGLETKLSFLKPFYADPGFIASFCERIGAVLTEAPFDHLLFSYHGLPERQIRKCDPSQSYCLKSADCCDRLNEKNSEFCYRAQCFESSRQIAAKLGLKKEQWSVAFQSRLGASKWITPYTDIVLNELADRGVKNLVITCPAFTSDCLETLEEIEMRANEQFLQRGGKTLRMVPSLNAHPSWVKAVCDLAQSSHFTSAV
jgi:ferrochelatase